MILLTKISKYSFTLLLIIVCIEVKAQIITDTEGIWYHYTPLDSVERRHIPLCNFGLLLRLHSNDTIFEKHCSWEKRQSAPTDTLISTEPGHWVYLLEGKRYNYFSTTGFESNDTIVVYKKFSPHLPIEALYTYIPKAKVKGIDGRWVYRYDYKNLKSYDEWAIVKSITVNIESGSIIQMDVDPCGVLKLVESNE